jgi:hypothetical protein
VEEEEQHLVAEVKRACTEASRRLVEDCERLTEAPPRQQELLPSEDEDALCRRRRLDVEDTLACKRSRTATCPVSTGGADAHGALPAADPAVLSRLMASAWRQGQASGLRRLGETVARATQSHLMVYERALDEHKRIYRRLYDQELSAAKRELCASGWPQWQH